MTRLSYQPRSSSAAALKRMRDHGAAAPGLLSRQALRDLVAQMID